MRLYTHPASTVGRPVAFFIADAGITVEQVVVDLFSGAQYAPEFLAINPNHAVPVLVDGDLTLTESSAILKYLADKAGCPAYPTELKARARVNAAMDWFNTGFYHAFGYDVCYEQLLDHYRLADGAARAAVIARGKARAEGYLSVLNDHMLGDGRPWVCGREITLADYLGSGIITLGDITGCGFAHWPNVQAWLARVKARPNWLAANGGIQGWAEMARGPAYVTM
jgi:glutathione S-transferase